jgi:predicted transcriptional regulator
MLTLTEKREHVLNVLLRAETLSSTEKLVAVVMVFKINDLGVVDLRMSEIAQLSSLTTRGIRYVLKRLQEKNIFDARYQGAKKTYSFVMWRML